MSTLTAALTWLCLSLLLCHAAASSANYPSLYKSNDRVETLNATNFYKRVYQSPKAAVVHFFNSFCGDCRRFSLFFKPIALQLYKWERILSVYVVDCAQEVNVQLCRSLLIKSVPALRFIEPNYELGVNQKGKHLSTEPPGGIIDDVAGYLSASNFEMPDAPDFSAVDHTEIGWLFEANNHLVLILIYLSEYSNVGRHLILNLLRWDNVKVRIVDSPSVAEDLGMDVREHHWYMKRPEMPLVPLESRDLVVAQLVQHVELELRQLNYTPRPTQPTRPMTLSVPNSLDELILETVARERHTYRADLEQAYDQLLHIELPKVEQFEAESLQALKKLLQLLHRFNPLSRSGKQLLERLNAFVQSKESLSGAELQAQVKAIEQTLPKIFKAKRYVGCLASQPLLRGYTCTLWTLFHYLTVQAAKPEGRSLSPGDVLRAMHGFVKHFFGCNDCVQHFLEMANRRRLAAVQTKDDEILWLWQAHNEVNQRLAGDSTEDPLFPKILFPRPEDCRECWLLKAGQDEPDIHATFNQFAVLKYLKEHYDSKSLSNYGLPNTSGYD